jgi:hypothetical protein
MAKLNYKHDDATVQQVATGLTSSDVGTGSVWDEVFYLDSGETDIVAGDWVVVDTSSTEIDVGRAIKQSTTTADEAAVGVALEAIAAGDYGLVRRRGLVNSDNDGVTVNLTAGTAAGEALATFTTAGEADTAVNTNINIVGVVWSPATPTIVEVRC